MTLFAFTAGEHRLLTVPRPAWADRHPDAVSCVVIGAGGPFDGAELGRFAREVDAHYRDAPGPGPSGLARLLDDAARGRERAAPGPA